MKAGCFKNWHVRLSWHINNRLVFVILKTVYPKIPEIVLVTLQAVADDLVCFGNTLGAFYLGISFKFRCFGFCF